MNGGGGNGIEPAASTDDVSCSSENSSGNKNFFSRSRSRSRSRSISRLRQRSRSVRDEKPSNATTNAADSNTNVVTNAKANTSTTTTLKRPKSPTKTIMKRLQRSFSSSGDRSSDHEKENTNPSTDPSVELPPSIDSTIVSIADLAVALNFPSSCIRPVPINREEIIDSLVAQTEDPATRKKSKDTQTTAPMVDVSNDILSAQESKKDGDIVKIGESVGEKGGEDSLEDSPHSIGHSNSLFPPLDDDGGGENDGIDDSGSRKMLYPEARVGMESPKKPIGREEASPKAFSPPRPNTNPCVSSPLSEGSLLIRGDGASSSCDSSVSVGRPSLVFDSDDGSNVHIANLAKSTFEPPREVVTITSVPILANGIPSTNPGRRRQRNESSKITTSENEDQKEDQPKEGTSTKGFSSSYCSGDDDETKTAKELAAKLIVDLEALREENEKQVAKNRRLESKLQILKAQQEEHMVHRGRLIKACLYTAPVFVLCGGLDAFLATILLVWVIIEVESYLDGNEGQDEEGDDGEDCDSQEGGENGSDVESFGDDGSSIAL